MEFFKGLMIAAPFGVLGWFFVYWGIGLVWSVLK